MCPDASEGGVFKPGLILVPSEGGVFRSRPILDPSELSYESREYSNIVTSQVYVCI